MPGLPEKWFELRRWERMMDLPIGTCEVLKEKEDFSIENGQSFFFVQSACKCAVR